MDSNFEEIYSNINNHKSKDFLKTNNYTFKLGIAALTLLAVEFIMTILYNIGVPIPKILFIIPLIVLIPIVILGLLNNKNNRKYQSIYEENIIKPIIKGIDLNYNISDNKIITKEIYEDADFRKQSSFKSFSGIYGKRNKREFQISEVDLLLDVNGTNTYYNYIFCYVKLDNTYNNPISLRSINNKIYEENHKNEQVELDSEQLNNYFKIYSKDYEKTKQIFNQNNNKRIIELLNKYPDDKYEVTIKDNSLYINIYNNHPILEAIANKDLYSKENIKRIYDSLNHYLELIDLYIEIVDNKE